MRVVAAAGVVVALLLVQWRWRGGGDVRVLEIGDGDVELVPLDGAAGPESVAFGAGGEGPYTGVSDGRVLRWRPAERRWEEHSCSAPDRLERCRGWSGDPGREHECGRPLGLRFDSRTGELYVADAYHGLRVVGPGDTVSRPLLPEGIRFANGVEVDHHRDGTGGGAVVYFTETSTAFQRREFLHIVISGDRTGRLLKYDPTSNDSRVQVLVDGLAFPNGLAMSADGSYLLLAETTTGRILRYRIGTATVEEAARLPWFPDNIKRSPRGGFWVGLHARRGKLAEWAISCPCLRRLLLSLPARHVQRASRLLELGRRRVIVAVRLSEEGQVVEAVSVRGDAYRVFRSVSEVEERNGTLFIGSVTSPVLGVYRL